MSYCSNVNYSYVWYTHRDTKYTIDESGCSKATTRVAIANGYTALISTCIRTIHRVCKSTREEITNTTCRISYIYLLVEILNLRVEIKMDPRGCFKNNWLVHEHHMASLLEYRDNYITLVELSLLAEILTPSIKTKTYILLSDLHCC